MKTARAKAPAPPPTCILVAGMHRCGTSALTRVLNLHGAALGGTILDGAPDNETGFWENHAVVSLHERLLADLGRAWSDPRPLPEHWRRTPAARRAEQAIVALLDSEFSGEALFAIKDPRLAPVLKLWINVLKRRGVRPVVCVPFRNPLEVAASLAGRDQLPPALSQLLWHQAMVAAARNSRGQPRVAVGYDTLLADWRATVRRVGDALGIAWPNTGREVGDAVDAFLSREHRHHVATDASGEPDPLLPALESLERAGDHAAAWKLIEDAPDPAADAAVHGDYAQLLAYRHSRQPPPRVATADAADGGSDPVLRSVLVARPPADDRVVVYFRSEGTPYSEDRAVHQAWPSGASRLEFRADLPAAAAGRLRIDPSEGHGWFVLRDLRLDGAAVAIEPLGRNGGVDVLDGELHLLGSDNDPWIEFDLAAPASARKGPRQISFVVERRGMFTHLGQLAARLGETIESQAAAASSAATGTLSAGMASIGHLVRSDVAQVHAQSAAMATDIAQMGHFVRSDVAMVHAQAALLLARIADMQAVIEAQEAGLAGLRDSGATQFSALLARTGDAHAAVDAHRAAQATHADAAEGRIAARMDAVDAGIAAAHAQAAQVDARVDALSGDVHALVGALADRVAQVEAALATLHGAMDAATARASEAAQAAGAAAVRAAELARDAAAQAAHVATERAAEAARTASEAAAQAAEAANAATRQAMQAAGEAAAQAASSAREAAAQAAQAASQAATDAARAAQDAVQAAAQSAKETAAEAARQAAQAADAAARALDARFLRVDQALAAVQAESAPMRASVEGEAARIRAEVAALAAEARQLDARQSEAAAVLEQIRQQLLRVEDRRVLRRLGKMLGVSAT